MKFDNDATHEYKGLLIDFAIN